MILCKINSGRQYPRKGLLVCLLMAMIMLTSACIAGSAVTQSPSPLSPSLASLLVGKRWEVVEITVGNESIQFEALKPIGLWFEQAGILNINSPHCPGGAFLIFFENEQHYKIGRGDTPAVGCSEQRTMQMSRVLDALKVTTQYEIQDNQLFLTGDNVRIVLEIDNP